MAEIAQAKKSVETLTENKQFDATVRVWGSKGMLSAEGEIGCYEVSKIEQQGYNLYFTSNGKLVFKPE